VSRQANKSDQPVSNNEYGKFTNLLDKLLSVPHSKIKAELDAEKDAKRKRPKHASASGRASAEKG
jgi:hypothetical protein